MRLFSTLVFGLLLSIPITLIHAQTPCGNIIAPEDVYDTDSPTTVTPIENCDDPFNVTMDAASPYTLFIGDDAVQEGGTVEIPEGGTNNFHIEGNPLLSGVNHIFYLHDGNDYRYVDTREVEPTEADYRRIAAEFFEAGVDPEPYIQAMITGDDPFETEDEENLYSEFRDYFDAHFVYAPAPLRAGTYTLVSKEYLLVVTQHTILQKFLALLLPTAHAQSYPENIFTLTFTVVEKPAVQDCCSSVAFLPGIKGSVLKKHALIGDDTLWPATLYSNDVDQLALTADGQSVEDVFVDGIVENYLSAPVYGPFSTFMDALVASGTIAAWEPLPYDWRLMPETILNDGVKTADGTVDLVHEIETLAANSPTGKVTLVAHSMGGLMGKAIIKKLQEKGEDDLIDSFVMVGSPQLGTPQTIGAILHGDDEGIPGDLEGLPSILNNSSVQPAAARALGQNMPSAYNLLPSAHYFEEVSDPVLAFDDQAAFTQPWRDAWGTTTSNYADYVSFLTGQEVARQIPAHDALNIPEVLNPDMIKTAQDFHDEYDSYEIPSHINVVEIAGWGRPTVKGIFYTTGNEGRDDYEPVFTSEGDKTVVYPSALSSDADAKYFFNILDYDKVLVTTIAHKDLLNVSSIQQVVGAIIQEKPIGNIDFVTSLKPPVSDVADQLMVSAHSPVVLSAHDSEGHFTGINSQEQTISEEIPGSSVIIVGESQYIFLPKEGMYTFSYAGTGDGPTTIKIEDFSDDTKTPLVTYSDIPTSPLTKATFDVNAAQPENTHINVDQDGNGTIDIVVASDQAQTEPEPELSRNELLALLQGTIEGSDMEKAVKKQLLVTTKVLQSALNAKSKIVQKIVGVVDIKIMQKEIVQLQKGKKVSDEVARILLELLDKIKNKI